MIAVNDPLLVTGVALAVAGVVLGFGKYLSFDARRLQLLDLLGYTARSVGTCVALIGFLSETSFVSFAAVISTALLTLLVVLILLTRYRAPPDEERQADAAKAAGATPESKTLTDQPTVVEQAP